MLSYNENKRLNLNKKQKKERDSYIRTKMGVIGKLYNIIIHIRSSAGRTQEFKDLTSRIILIDNCTRWNSWNNILKVALDSKVKPAL
jgi:hypothetical protein